MHRIALQGNGRIEQQAIKMKTLVTGGAGFIASHLTKELIKQGHSVWVLDTLHTGSLSNLGRYRKKIHFRKTRAGTLSSLNQKFDIIFHLGMPSSSPMYRQNHSLFSQTIDDATRILDYCRQNNVPLVYASTSSLYGNRQPPAIETAPIIPTDFYTETRYCIERLAKVYNDLYGVRSIGLRYFSVYGDGEQSKGKYANLISQFIWAAKKKQHPVIYGDGYQSRDFIHVNDVVRANLLSWELLKDKTANLAEIINIGTGKCHSLNYVIRELSEALQLTIKPKYIPNPIKNYIMKTRANTNKAKFCLGFETEIPLEKGIRMVLKKKGTTVPF